MKKRLNDLCFKIDETNDLFFYNIPFLFIYLQVGIGLMLIQQLSGASGITYYSNAIFRKSG